MNDKIFGVLQRVGRSFMLPIALLPIAGLLLGIGSSLTNPVMLQTYGLDGAIHESTVPYAIFNLMAQCGSAVFSNLPLLFAMGVAIGMAKKEKAVAALSGAISYLVMNVSIYSMIEAHGGVDSMAPNTTTTVLGITTLQMGVFGGIIVGLGVAALHNRFYKIQLPQVLSFFGGTRFVPIISTAVYLLVGVGMFYLWPFVQAGITAPGGLVLKSGYAGTWVYGVIERALIPFGLHHVFYMPFRQTAMGQCHPLLRLRDTLYVGQIPVHDIRSAGRRACDVPHGASRKAQTRRQPAAVRRADQHDHGYHRTA